MIAVTLKPEPAAFRAKVFDKGQKYLEKTKPVPPVQSPFWKNHEYWQDGLDLLAEAYGHICAYSSMYINPVTGARTVEHLKPKAHYPQEAYTWRNLRYVCLKMNARKGDFEDVLDPCSFETTVFMMSLFTGEISVHPRCPRPKRPIAQSTIDRLQLNDGAMMDERLRHLDNYKREAWSRAEFRRQSPFVYQCAQEQGLL